MLILVSFVWRVALFCVAWAAQATIPYLGFFPYGEVLPDYKLPSWFSAFANFDGLHYLFIAKQGYSQYEQAFFPLYPLVVRVISLITHNGLVSGVLVSWLAFLGGLAVFRSLLAPMFKNRTFFILLLFISFPYSFFFGAVYTEALFFFLLMSSLYFVEKRRYALAAICATLTSLTRLSGVFLVLPFAVALFGGGLPSGRGQLARSAITLISPLFGFFIYAVFLFFSTGDPFYFLSSQPAFGANRSTSIVLLPQVLFRYAKMLLFADRNLQWFLAFSELVFFLLSFLVLLWGLWREVEKNKWRKPSFVLGLVLFSLANLMLPTLTGTLSSIGRYAVLSVGIFVILGSRLKGWVSVVLSVLFILLQLVFLSMFIQGYFVG